MPDGAERPGSAASPQGDAADLSADGAELSAQLSSLLKKLAEIPEAEVDVAAGWTPGLKPGDEVGRFVLERELGRGGFGVVYEALDRDLNRAVAFKAIRPGRRLAGQSETWLRAEAEAVARLNHPNIVTLHDFGTGPSGPYLIFELLRGETLAEKLHAGPLPLRDAVDVAVVLTRVLAHAHAADVIHRDLKPANVFLCEDGAVKVLDFGLAHLFGRGGPRYAGTPGYMAPEQWRSERGDGRIDLFALGSVLYQMITGALPYRVTKERSEALEPGPPPRLPAKAAPAPLRALVSRLLEKEPFARPRNAQEVLDELLPIQRRLGRHRGGRRRWLALAAAAGVALGAGLWAAAGRAPPFPANGPVVVAVADFANGTGDRDLDGLSGLLVTSLEQSRRLQVLTRSRLIGLLRSIGRTDAGAIDETVGRELARVAGARVLLVGSAERAGTEYALRVRALDPRAGRSLFTVHAEAPRKDEIAGALDRLSTSARRALREREDEIRGAQVKLADAVTGNVEAYRAYFDGQDCMDRPSRAGSWVSVRACADLFRQALALDPTFALAHYQLAFLLGTESGPPEDLDAHLSAALRYIDRAPPKEAELIRAWKDHVDGNEDGALTRYGRVLAAFPEDKQALYLAGDLQYHRDQLAGAIPFFEKLLALDPSAEWPLDHLVDALGAQRRVEELKGVLSRITQEASSQARTHARIRGLVWLGDVAAAIETARGAIKAGGGAAAQGDLATALATAGRFADAEAIYREMDAADREPGTARFGLVTTLRAQGRRTEGLRLLSALEKQTEYADLASVIALYVAGDADKTAFWRACARGVARDPAFASPLAVLLALRGDLPHAAQLASGLRARSTEQLEYEALTQWRKGDGAGAMAQLAALEARDPAPWWNAIAPSFLLAEVAWSEGEFRESAAAAARYRTLWPRGVWRGWAYPRSLWLSAASYERLGDRASARAAMDELLALLARAEQGDPLAAAARALSERVKP